MADELLCRFEVGRNLLPADVTVTVTEDVSDVVRVVDEAGIATRVGQLRPIGVIKD